MKNTNKLNCRDKLFYLNIIAQKEAEKAAALAEKDEMIERYRRAAETATQSKRRALAGRAERRKDIICWGILCFFIVVAALLAVAAGNEFLLWASGR